VTENGTTLPIFGKIAIEPGPELRESEIVTNKKLSDGLIFLL